MEPRKHYFARIPTIALLVLFAMSPWVGVLLYIFRAIDRDALKKERERDAYTYDFRAEDTGIFTADPEHVYGHDTPTAEQEKAKKWQKDISSFCTVIGAAFLIIGLRSFGDGPTTFREVTSALAQIVGGGGALYLSWQMTRARKLERQLDKIVGDRDNIPLDELFAAAGIDRTTGRQTLEKAIDHGYFGADAYIDNRTDILVVRGPAPQPPQEEDAPSPAPTEDEYASLLRQLRNAKEAVRDPELQAKVARLEQLSERIFALAKKDPEKRAQLQKFMDYYLPTALKLLKTYSQLPAQDVQGKNITEAKQSIDRSMDLLATAFENQLDKLYQADALDVTTDIAALEGMLNLDGLTGEEFSVK